METIKASGQFFIRNGKVSTNINMSSIWTALIKEAAKCESYASDIILDIDSIREKMECRDAENFTYYLGFRDHGVDHEAFIRSRGKDAKYAYRVIMALHISYQQYAGHGNNNRSFFINATLEQIDELPE